MARNERAFNMAQLWISWLDTRKFFAPPAQKNILAMMMQEPQASRGEPDGELSADIFAFNLCVVSLPIEQFIPFVVVYCQYKPRPVKVMAHELGIQAPAFYDRAHTSALKVLHDADRLVRLNTQMQNEVIGFV